jgi:hypothetical protein
MLTFHLAASIVFISLYIIASMGSIAYFAKWW